MRPGEYITGDTHFGHETLLRTDYAARPFSSVEEMDETMIRLWNEKIPARGAIVYHIGDVTFHDRRRTNEILYQLHGTIRLIRGNHDRSIKGSLAERFDWVKDYYEAKTEDGRKIVMCHYPMLTWNKSHHGSWMLHGHSHGNLTAPESTRLDVGVDVHGFAPLSYEEVVTIMVKREFTSVDHHKGR